MLIVAMPKTASTSLIYTLNECTKLRIQPHVEKTGWSGNTRLFRELSKYHKSVYLKTYDLIDSMAKDKNTIYRDHILPEEDGLRFLNKTEERIVILYRRHDHIFDNYKRTARNVTEALRSELQFMSNKYFEHYDKDNYLFISYRDLVTNPVQTIGKIALHLGLELTKRPVLLKKKFTGEGLKRL